MKRIDKNTSEIELSVGGGVYYQATVHGSIGVNFKLDFDNKEILKITKIKTNYRNPNRKTNHKALVQLKPFY